MCTHSGDDASQTEHMIVTRDKGFGARGSSEVDQVLVVRIDRERLERRFRIVEQDALLAQELDVRRGLRLGDVTAEPVAVQDVSEFGQELFRSHELEAAGAKLDQEAST